MQAGGAGRWVQARECRQVGTGRGVQARGCRQVGCRHGVAGEGMQTRVVEQARVCVGGQAGWQAGRQAGRQAMTYRQGPPVGQARGFKRERSRTKKKKESKEMTFIFSNLF